MDSGTLKEVLVSSGVTITTGDADAVARSLARIDFAAATLLQSLSFDETVERFYRLIENGAAAGADE